ncbi:MAG: FHA domain-containing protein [Deltaproteobacteria bacterium]|nr:FHA domain-containing protein [Deltaproteobacteria bacterium]
MLKLVIRTGAKAGKTIPVEERLRMGRSQDNDLFLPDPQISRNHAEIRREGEEWWVEDFGSYNGTLVNEIRIEKRALRDGDLVRVGNTELQVVLPPRRPTSTQRLLVTQEISQDTPLVVRAAEQMALPDLERVGLDNYLRAAGISGIQEPHAGADGSPDPDRLLRQAQQFAVLYDAARSFQKNLGVDGIVDTAVEYVLQVFKAVDQVTVILVDPETSELVPRLSKDRQGKTQDEVHISQTVLGEVINSRRAVICTDARQDERFSGAQSIMMYGLRSILCVPMVSLEHVLGLVQVTSSARGGAFSEEDMFLLTVLSSLAATALENARLVESQQRTIEELQAAQATLVNAQERLVEQERLASVGQLASGIVHEIRNMLGPIMLAEMIRSRYPADDVIREYSDAILESHKRILDLVGEVRAFSSGQGTALRPEPTALARLVKSVVRFLRFDREVKEVPIELHVEEDLVVEVDADKIKQVLVNLIRNAVQAVDRGAGRVNVLVGVAEARAYIQVVDNGAGIPEEIQDQIWIPFFTTREGTGTGLGLHVSKGIVERHGGSLECTSVPGKGTRMTVWLPMAGPAAPQK